MPTIISYRVKENKYIKDHPNENLLCLLEAAALGSKEFHCRRFTMNGQLSQFPFTPHKLILLFFSCQYVHLLQEYTTRIESVWRLCGD